MALSAVSFATPTSKNSVHRWEARGGSSLAETRILTEKTSPSVSERVAQRIKDRNRTPVHLCICKKPQRGKRAARPGVRAKRLPGPGSPVPAGRRAGAGGTLSWGVCPSQSCRGEAGAGLVPRRALTAWPRPRRAPAALYGQRSGRAGSREPRAAHRLPPPPPGRSPAALGRAEITAIQLEALGSTTRGAGSCSEGCQRALCPRPRGTGERASLIRDPRGDRGVNIAAQRPKGGQGSAHRCSETQGETGERASLLRDPGTGGCLREGTWENHSALPCSAAERCSSRGSPAARCHLFEWCPASSTRRGALESVPPAALWLGRHFFRGLI